MEGKFRGVAGEQTYPVTVDVTRSFEDMRTAAGPWTYWNPDINETNFRLGEGELDVRGLALHHFNRAIGDAQATQELGALGFERVTELPVILAFLEANPDLLRQFPIITGAAWVNSGDVRRVVYASGDSQHRGLSLNWDGLGWHARCRFLVRRK